MFQWKVELDHGDEEVQHLNGELKDAWENDEKISRQGNVSTAGIRLHDPTIETFEFGDQHNGGDEFMACKPWLGAIKAPTKYDVVENTAPDADLELKWVNGFTSSVRNCVLYIDMAMGQNSKAHYLGQKSFTLLQR